MNPELWGQVIVPVALAVCGFLGMQVRVLHVRISKRDLKIEAVRKQAQDDHRALDNKVDAAMLLNAARLTRLETLVEGIDKKLDKLNGR